MLQATSFGLFTLFALATIIAATPEPDQVVPEMLENVAPVAPVGEPQASTPGHYTVTQDGSYTVKNENYANDTPAPYPGGSNTFSLALVLTCVLRRYPSRPRKYGHGPRH